jgi:DNA replication protein
MNTNFINLIKDRPYVIPKILISNYRSIGITDSELIILMVVMSYGDKVVYDPETFASDLGRDKHEIMKIINELIDKNILELVIEKKNQKAYEYISLDILYDKLYNMLIGKEEESVVDESVFSVFEGELGRLMSPMEYEKIKEWITSGNSNELIILALKEAVMKGVSNFNYIDSILNNWKKKGIKNKSDIEKEKEQYRNKKEKTEVFDTDWLNE